MHFNNGRLAFLSPPRPHHQLISLDCPVTHSLVAISLFVRQARCFARLNSSHGAFSASYQFAPIATWSF